MSRLLIELPVDRDVCGRLTLFDENGKTLCGPFPVAGRAGDAVAAANGNPRRDPLLRYGDTPTGVYAVRHLLKSGKGTPFNASEFGARGVVVIEGVAGEAAYAEANGRFHLLISGGAPSVDGRPRATAGGLRLSDADMAVLFVALKRSARARCEIVEEDGPATGERVNPDAPLGLQDPFPLQLKEPSRPGGAQLREGLLSGAMVFGMTVSFVAMQTSESRASTLGTSTDRLSAHDQGKTAPPAALPAPRYVRLAYDTTGGGPAPANNAAGQLNNATNGKQTLGQTFDGGKTLDDATVDGGGVKVTPLAPSQAPAPLSQEQQQQLNNDTQYQQYQQQYSTAQKAAAEAVAKQQDIQAQITTVTDPAQKAQLQVDLAKARQDESNANSTAAAAQTNAETRKKVVVQGAPIIKK